MVLHSAGGFLGSMAIEGLSVKERNEAGKEGGVIGLVFVAGAVWEEGFQHGPLPFFEYRVSSFFSSNSQPKQIFKSTFSVLLPTFPEQ